MLQLTLLAFFLLACSEGSPTGNTASEPGGELLPLDAFFLDVERDAFQREVAAHEDRELAMQECLAADGFTYVPRQVESTPPEHAQRGPESLRVNGYGIATFADERFVGAVSFSQGGLLIEGLSESELAAAQEASDLCLKRQLQVASDARAEQSVESQSLLDRYRVIEQGYQDASAADPRTLAAFASWSRCMNELGYPFDSPFDSFRHVTQYVETEEDIGKHAEYELQVAAHDADCLESAGVMDVVAELEREFVEEHRTMLELMALAGISPDR